MAQDVAGYTLYLIKLFSICFLKLICAAIFLLKCDKFLILVSMIILILIYIISTSPSLHTRSFHIHLSSNPWPLLQYCNDTRMHSVWTFMKDKMNLCSIAYMYLKLTIWDSITVSQLLNLLLGIYKLPIALHVGLGPGKIFLIHVRMSTGGVILQVLFRQIYC